MIARTQIGGKYDQAEQSLFGLKCSLEAADIEVTHPSSYGIVCTVDGRGYTFDPHTASFYDIESDYYRSIAESDFHTVNNRFLSKMGYVGVSAALEITYAMLHDRPILLMHPLDLTPSVEPFYAEVINERASLLHIHDMANMDAMAIAEVAESIKGQYVDYDISARIGRRVLNRIEQLFEEIQNL